MSYVTRSPWSILFWATAAAYWVLSIVLARDLVELLITLSLFLGLVALLVWARVRIKREAVQEARPPQWLTWILVAAGALLVIDLTAAASTEDAILDGLLLASLVALVLDMRTESSKDSNPVR